MFLSKNRKDTCFAIIYSFFFCFFNVFICFGRDWKTLNNGSLPIVIFFMIVLTLICAEAYLRILYFFRVNPIIHSPNKNNPYQYFVFVFLFHIVMYGLVFLAYYPGIFAYDVNHQLLHISTKHPLLHTLYLRFFYYILGQRVFQNVNLGIAFATILQLVIFSFFISLSHIFLYHLNVNKVIRYIFVFFTSSFPVYSIMAVSLTKDVFFSCFVLMYILAVSAQILKINFKYHNLFYIISVVGIVCFRNNGIYPLLVVGIYFFLQKLIKKKSNNLYKLLVGIVLSLTITSSLKYVLNATSGSKNILLSIPYQQIANVYNKEYNNLDQSTKNACEKIIPDIELYNPYIADDIKRNATGMMDKSLFFKTYFNLLVKYPVDYINSFAQTNSGYLYIFDVSNATLYSNNPLERKGYLLTFTYPGFDVKHVTKLPLLEKTYEWLFSANNYQKIFPLNVFCSFSLYFWILLLFCFFSIQDKKEGFIEIVLFFVSFLGTLLLGPCALIRYALPYVISLPIVITTYIYKHNN